MFSISYSLTAIYYAFSVSYLYCCFLTPKEKVQRPYCTCCLLMLPNVFIPFFCPSYFALTTFISLGLPLILFKDTWRRRISSYVIAYLIQLLAELTAANLSLTIFYLLTGEVQTAKLTPQSDGWRLLLLALLIIISGMLLILAVAPLLKKWFRYFHTGTLAMLGLPLVVEMLVHNLLVSWDSSPYYPICLVIALIIYIGCYFPLAFGFRDMHRQELARKKRENQQMLMQKQLSYSLQLEREYKELRKWNHDISNHFISLSYLLNKGKYDQSIMYLNTLLDIEDGTCPLKQITEQEEGYQQ